MKIPVRFDALFCRQAMPLLAGILGMSFIVPSTPHAATVTFDGGSSGLGTALDTAANWSGDVLPDTTSEVLFSSLTLPSSLVTSTTINVWGSLLWNTNATSAITIDSTTATNRNLHLSGLAGSAEAIAQGGAAGDLILLGTNALTNTLTIGGNAGTGTGRLNVTLLAGGNFNVVSSGATLHILSAVSGNFSLTKTGAGTLTLAGANSFGSSSTSFTLSAGTLNLNSATALGGSGNTFVIGDGTTFDNTSGAAITTSSYKQIWNGGFTFTGTHNLTLGSGTVSLGTAAGASRVVTVAGGTLALSGVISNGTTASSVVKEGAGTLLLGGASTFTGGFVVREGVAMAGASAAFGAAAGTITLGDTSGSRDASLLGSGVSSITIASPIVVASGSTGNTLTIGTASQGVANTTFNNTISLGHDLLVTAGAAPSMTSLSGIISEDGGARGLTVNAGTGTVSITGANTFTGGLTLNSGRLIVANGSTSTGALTINGGLLDTVSTSANTAATLGNASYLWNGDFSVVGTTGITLSGGNVLLGGNRVVTVNVINSPLFTISGAIGDAGAGYSLTKAGGGTLNLNGASTYTGATIMTRGILNLTQAGSSLAGTSSVTVTGGSLNLGVASGTGVANRINAAASLTLGGSGIFSLSAGATGPVNSQAFSSLTILPGSSQLSTTSATNAGTYAFTGPAESVYSRAMGGVTRIVVGTNTTFANAPTGGSVVGAGTSALLVGAVTGVSATTTAITDFVRASAGAVSAPVYGTNAWATGVNTTVTAPLYVSGPTQSLRFHTVGHLAVTIAGTSTIESGGILVTGTAIAGGTITGGQIQAPAGQDLWAYVSTLAANPQGLKIDSLIADNASSSLTKGGVGALYLTNSGNTYAGGTYLGEGILNITSGGALGTGPLHFTGNATLQAGAADVNLGARAVTIGSGQTASFHTNGSGNTLTVSGVISGGGGLTKTGAGTLVLSAASTYTGTTAIDNGTLKLDFTAADAPVSDIIPASSLVSPGGGSFSVVGAFSQTLLIQGKDATANSQTFGGVYTNLLGYDTPGLYLNRGMTHINLVAGGNGGTLTVNVGAVSRGYSTDVGSSVDFAMGPGVTVLATGIGLSNFATVNGETWATVSGGFLTGMPTASYSSNYAGAGAVLDVGGGGTLMANPASIRFNESGAATVAPGSNVVRAFLSGGILVTPNVGAATSTISSGFIAGYGARDLIIHQNNTAGILQIDAALVDSGGRTQSLTKNGAGTVVFTAANGYAAASYINEGTVIAAGDATASFTRTATASSGSAVLTMSNTTGIVLGQSVTEATALASSGVTWTVVAINPGVSVTLSSNASASLSGGTFTFGAVGAVGGGTSSTHYIAPGATLQIGNGGTTGSMLNTQLVSNNGTFVINRSNDLTFASNVSGAGSFEKQGAGDLTLSVASTFTGDTRVAGGTLILSTVSSNLQSSTLDYNNYGGVLSFGTLTAVTLGGLEGAQNLVLTNAATTPAAVALTVGGNHQDTIYTGALSGLGSISKLGGGALTLGGANTYTGTTSMTQGTLNLAGTFTATGNISASGGVLNMSGTFTDLGPLSLSGGVVNLSGSYTRTLAYSSGAGLTVTGGVLNVSGTLGTSAAVPLGQTAFSGNSVSNFSGTVFLSGSSSTFRVGEASSATVNVTGGALTIGSSSGGVVLGRTNAAASGFLNVSGGSFVVTGGSSIRVGAGFVDTETSGASAISISGTGSFTTGTTTGLFLLGSNLATNSASSGTLNLDGGTLSTNRSITGGSSGSSIVNLNGGTFKATGTAATLATSLTTVNVRDGGAVIDTNGFNITIAEPLLHSTIVGDNAIDGGLTKHGAGTLALSGISTYAGATVVAAGNLQVGVAGVGSIGTGATSLNGADAVLSGSGLVQGSTVVILGQISPGDSGGAGEGTLSFANGLAFTPATAGTVADLTIQGTTAANESGDRISIIGDLTLDGSSSFVVSTGASWTPTENQSWTLMDWSGLLSLNDWNIGTNLRSGSNADGNEGNLDLPDLSSYSLNWSISSLLDGTSGGALTLTIVNLVPEPSRALLLLIGLSSLSLRRRSRSAP